MIGKARLSVFATLVAAGVLATAAFAATSTQPSRCGLQLRARFWSPRTDTPLVGRFARGREHQVEALNRARLGGQEGSALMEFLVEFEVEVPEGTRESEVEQRLRDEAAAAAKLVDEGHLLRVWRRNAVADDPTVIGLYAADSEAKLDGLLGALPLADWMQVTVIPLAPHPNDPIAVAR